MSKKTKMVICRNCNTAIEKKAKICPSCGAKNRKPFYKKMWFFIVAIIVVIGIISSISNNKTEKFEWNHVELNSKLPKPESNSGRIVTNSDTSLSVRVENLSEGDYKEYMSACQAMGYTVESERRGDNYDAFDEEGYKLSLSYIGETMYIDLDAPEKMGILNWPKSEVASLVPIPKSATGKVSRDSSDGCYIYVAETPIEAFNNYIDLCVEAGFDVDYERGDKYYKADDKNGNYIYIRYNGNNVMSIEVKKEEDKEDIVTQGAIESTKVENQTIAPETEAPTSAIETEAPNVNSELVNGMRSDFKNAMDSYEAFMIEYCDFMNKYAASDGTDFGLLADYAIYMAKYVDMMADFEAWNSQDMNAAETAYYMEVQTRINKKLLEVAQ